MKKRTDLEVMQDRFIQQLARYSRLIDVVEKQQHELDRLRDKNTDLMNQLLMCKAMTNVETK